uniref:Uncharacterized protein n=1 Tax=Lutzomyia longipalpis TaxID=7200 RepID=A0A1B0CAN1_LUTLO
MAKTPTIMFFTKRSLNGPRALGHLKTVSTTAGTKSPSVEKKSAPTRLMNGSRLGTAAAMADIMRMIPQGKEKDYSHLILWQIERYATLDNISKAHVAEETHYGVQDNYSYHCGVENTGTSKEVLWFPHGILNGHHNTNSLHCEDHSAWELCKTGKEWFVVEFELYVEHEVESDAECDDDEEVGDS